MTLGVQFVRGPVRGSRACVCGILGSGQMGSDSPLDPAVRCTYSSPGSASSALTLDTRTDIFPAIRKARGRTVPPCKVVVARAHVTKPNSPRALSIVRRTELLGSGDTRKGATGASEAPRANPMSLWMASHHDFHF
jgi:hypothetical protein